MEVDKKKFKEKFLGNRKNQQQQIFTVLKTPGKKSFVGNPFALQQLYQE